MTTPDTNPELDKALDTIARLGNKAPTAPQDTEKLVKELHRYSICVDQFGDGLTIVPKRMLAEAAALLSSAGREGEIERLRATLERADYYINRLEAAHRGHVVRDLDEACNAWESCKHRIALSTPAPPRTDVAGPECSKRDWPDPTPEMLTTPEFNAVWNCIKKWDINVPGAYVGYCGATGNHVREILNALAFPVTSPTAPPDFIDTIAMDTARTIFSCPPNVTDDVTRAKALIADAMLKVIAEHDRRAGAVREGWKLVPEKPTQKMRLAGVAEWSRSDPTPEHESTLVFNAIYRVMIAASPLPGEQGGQSASLTNEIGTKP